MPSFSDDSPNEFFTELLSTFDRATSAVGVESVGLRMADRSVVLEFAGSQLRGLMVPALAHRLDDELGDDFSIKIFDSSSTGVSPPSPPWGPNDYLAQGEIAGFNDARFKTAFRVESGSLSMIDLERRMAVFWIREPAAYPRWMQAAPLRTLFGWWAAGIGLQMIHGAGVGTAEAGVLITARGGSGKSTTALRCLMAGLHYAGDDYVIVDPVAHRIYSVYCTAKADDASIDHFFPTLRPHSFGRIAGDRAKHVFFLDQLYPNQLSDLPLSALAIPELSDQPTTTFSLSGPATALRALAPTTLFQLAGAGREEFAFMADFVRSVPIYNMCISSDDEVAESVMELLRTLDRVPT